MTPKGKRATRRYVRRIDVKATGRRTVVNTTRTMSESYKNMGGGKRADALAKGRFICKLASPGYGHKSCRTRTKKNEELGPLPPEFLTQYCRGMGWGGCVDPRANNRKLAAV